MKLNKEQMKKNQDKQNLKKKKLDTNIVNYKL